MQHISPMHHCIHPKTREDNQHLTRFSRSRIGSHRLDESSPKIEEDDGITIGLLVPRLGRQHVGLK